MTPFIVLSGALLLAAGRALAQGADDPATTIAVTAKAEADMAAEARAVTRTAIDTVFGAGQGTAPGGGSAGGTGSAAPADGAALNGSGTDGTADPLAWDAAIEGGAAADPAAEPRRDPFRPFTLDLQPDTQEAEILSPLQRYEIAQLRLAGTIADLSPPRAMLQDSAGMGFIITPGTPIGRRQGVVKAIETGRVIVEEVVLDYYGRQQVHQVVIEMPKDDKGGEKP